MDRPKALERAERDVAGGDLGAGRTRLASLLASNGYDAEIIGRLGRLCLQMGDRAEAGRYLLLSTEVGEEVEGAIATFLRLHRHDPRQVLRQLPRFARNSWDRLPEVVHKRLQAVGVAEASRSEAAEKATVQRGGSLVLIGCLGVGLLVLALLVIGAVSSMKWLLK